MFSVLIQVAVSRTPLALFEGTHDKAKPSASLAFCCASLNIAELIRANKTVGLTSLRVLRERSHMVGAT